MIDKLPEELIRLIIYYLSITDSVNCCNDLENVYDNLPLEPKTSELARWNDLQDHESLMNLAQTCKRLKSIVYTRVFNAWACKAKSDEKKLPGRDMFYHENSVSLLPDEETFVPRFVVHLTPHIFPKEALKYVDTFFISTLEPHGPKYHWLPIALAKMTMLRQVTLMMTTFDNVDNCMYTIGSLADHKNDICIDFLLYNLSQKTLRYWDLYETKFSRLRELNIKSWLILVNVFLPVRFPAGFITTFASHQNSQKLAALECTTLTPLFELNDQVKVSMVNEILAVINNAPDIETFRLDFSIPQDPDDWIPGPRLSKMDVSCTIFKSFHTYEMFDNITHLELHCNGSNHTRKRIPVRNLKELRIHYSKEPTFRPTLEYLVCDNPNLVNLCIFDMAYPLAPTQLRSIFAKIERLVVHGIESSITREITAHAPKLTYFSSISQANQLFKNDLHGGKINQLMLKTRAEEFKAQAASPHLSKICFQFMDSDVFPKENSVMAKIVLSAGSLKPDGG